MSQLTINELMSLKMKRNNITQKMMAEKLGISEGSVSQLINVSKNHWIETVRSFFDAMNEPFEIIHKGYVFTESSTVVTMGQLRKTLGSITLKFGNGETFNIIPFK